MDYPGKGSSQNSRHQDEIARFSLERDFLSPVSHDLGDEYYLLREITTSKDQLDRLVVEKEFCSYNRYTDVYAYSDTLTWLDPQSKSVSSYVHANMVHPPKGVPPSNIFIASQAPIAKGIQNFLVLLILQRVSVVINLVEPKEIGAKCYKYWTDSADPVAFGNFEVSCLSLEKDHHLVRRTLRVKNIQSGKEHSFLHLHYLSWIDHFVPRDNGLRAFVDMFPVVKKAFDATGAPALIHCSAGIGRTGTFIVGYHLWSLSLAARRSKTLFKASIFDLTRKVREQRFRTVETEPQYAFLYELAERFAQEAFGQSRSSDL